MDAKRCADRLVVHAHTAITSMPGCIARYCPSMPGVLRALVCPDLSVTQGTWPSALCQVVVGESEFSVCHYLFFLVFQEQPVPFV